METIIYYGFVRKEFVNGINTGLLDNIDLDLPIDINLLEGISKNSEIRGNYINNLKLIIIVLELVVIFFMIIYMMGKIKLFKFKNTQESVSLKPTLINSVFILAILMSFQGIIVIVSGKFNYGSNNELKVRFVNSLLKAKGEPEIDIGSGTKLF